MRRRALAVLSVLALASCFGRVSAWANAPGDAHACCRGESSAPAKGPVLAECCAVTAAVGAVKAVPASLTFIIVESPALATSVTASPVTETGTSPPGPQTFRSAVPARAPPRA